MYCVKSWIDSQAILLDFVTTYIHGLIFDEIILDSHAPFAGLPDSRNTDKSAKNYLLPQFSSDLHKIFMGGTSYYPLTNPYTAFKKNIFGKSYTFLEKII